MASARASLAPAGDADNDQSAHLTSASPFSSESGKFEAIPRRRISQRDRPRFAQRIERIHAFINRYPETLQSENKRIALPDDILRETHVIAAAPTCPYRRKLFNLGLISVPPINDRLSTAH
jgi:hypothetical protein